MAAKSNDRIPEGLLTGLKNYWYPILRSQDLGNDAPLGITRIGEKLVLWRDSKGEVHAFQDRCAHRCAALSQGRICNDDRLECWYHGLRYDTTGQCRLVPTENEGEDGPLARRLKVRTYPVEEKGGVIWCYVGDTETASAPPLQIEPEFTDPQFSGSIEMDIWEGNWLLAWDNGTDPAHTPFLHGTTLFLSLESGAGVIEEIKAQPSDAGIIISRVGVSDDERWSGHTFDAVEFVLPGYARLWFPIPGSEMRVRVLQYMLPIDAENTLVIAYFGTKVENEQQRQYWRLTYDKVIWPNVQEVFAQDAAIVKGQGNVWEATENENLIASDAGLPHVRKLIRDAYASQQ